MDSKISQFPAVTTVLPTDILPIVSGGSNKTITAGVFSTNLPNIGNTGITKNLPFQVSVQTIPLVKSLYILPVSSTSFILPNGVDGQEIKIISDTANTILPVGLINKTSISMGAGSSIYLVYIGSSNKWYPLSIFNCTLN